MVGQRLTARVAMLALAATITIVIVKVMGRDVAAIMVGEGWARPYNGSLKKAGARAISRDDLIPGPPPKREEKR